MTRLRISDTSTCFLLAGNAYVCIKFQQKTALFGGGFLLHYVFCNGIFVFMFSVIYKQTISKKASFSETVLNSNGMFSLQHATQFFSVFQQQTHNQFQQKTVPEKGTVLNSAFLIFPNNVAFAVFDGKKQRNFGATSGKLSQVHPHGVCYRRVPDAISAVPIFPFRPCICAVLRVW